MIKLPLGEESAEVELLPPKKEDIVALRFLLLLCFVLPVYRIAETREREQQLPHMRCDVAL